MVCIILESCLFLKIFNRSCFTQYILKGKRLSYVIYLVVQWEPFACVECGLSRTSIHWGNYRWNFWSESVIWGCQKNYFNHFFRTWMTSLQEMLSVTPSLDRLISALLEFSTHQQDTCKLVISSLPIKVKVKPHVVVHIWQQWHNISSFVLI